MTRKTPQPGTPLMTLAGVTCALSLAACGSVSTRAADGPVVMLHPADFVAGPDHAAVDLAGADEPTTAEIVPAPPDPGIGSRPRGPVLIASSEPDRLETSPGRPIVGATAADPLEQAELIDGKVGDINGRPIYVDDFLAPLEARLRAEATRLSAARWNMLARLEIARRLDAQITDELLRAEALAKLTPEQRQGLRAFIAKARENYISKGFGSEQIADQRLRDERGKSLDEVMREERETTLIRLEIINEVNRRVNVSWRDIKQRYDRDFKLWNPDPVAVFRMIRVSGADEDARDEVARRLADGEDFASIASDENLNGFNPADGGVQRRAFDGEFSSFGSFFGPEPLSEAARTLAPGEPTGPIEFGTLVAWLYLDGIESTGVSLYDAQLQISDQLLSERRQEELDRYISRLVERARVSNRDEILDRLVQIAVRRYGPSE